MGRKDKASRSEQAANNQIARNQRRQVVPVADMPDATNYVRRRCTKEKPCLGLYAMESGNALDTALPVTSVDPVSSLEINDTELAHAGVFEFTEAFYAYMGSALPQSEARKLAPFFDAGVRLLADRRPYALGILRERFALGRSIRALVQLYSTHHETLDRQLTAAMQALRDCVLEAQQQDVA